MLVLAECISVTRRCHAFSTRAIFRLWYNVHGLSKLALRLHLARNLAHATLVGGTVLLEEVERVGLGGVARVRVVEQVLDTQQDLLDGNCRLPALFLICVR